MDAKWYRWWHGSANDPKLRMIASECSMPVACVVGVWAYILETASSNHVRGRIDNWDSEVVSFHLGVDVETPCNAMKRRKMLHETDDVLFVCNWEKWQPKRERDDSSTDRVRKYRDKQKQGLAERNANETPCNANETLVTPREEKSRQEVNTTRKARFDFFSALVEEGVSESVANDYIITRKAKKLPATQTAFNGIKSEVEKSGMSFHDAIETCCHRGWGGFKASWLSVTQSVSSSDDVFAGAL